MIQGGDIYSRGGKGGESIYGNVFDDELLSLKHNKPFLLSMANRSSNTNSSQFFITTAPAPHLDGKHVIFGSVVKGRKIILQLEKTSVNGRYQPVVPVTIDFCGELNYNDIEKKNMSGSRNVTGSMNITGSMKDFTGSAKDTEEDLDPGVMPPPEVMDEGPNWLDRTIPYNKFKRKNPSSGKTRKLIPWDLDYERHIEKRDAFETKKKKRERS